MSHAPKQELHDGLTLVAERFDQLIQAIDDGAGLFELFEITDERSVQKYIDVSATNNSSDPPLSLSEVLHSSSDATSYIATLLAAALATQRAVCKSADPAINYELSRLLERRHSRFELLARADARTARPPSFPQRGHPEAVYRLVASLCNTPEIHSASIFEPEIGIVHTACNELIFRRGLIGQSRRDLGSDPVKVSQHPDYVCWDEDDSLNQLPGWPDWANLASWFENLPLESDLLVMELFDAQRHFDWVSRNNRYARARIVMLLPPDRHPRCPLHPWYKWLWHPMNVFVGVHFEAPRTTKSAIRALASSIGMEAAAPTPLATSR